MIKAVFVIIDKSTHEFPMSIFELPVSEQALWDWYHKEDLSIIKAAKALLGIRQSTPTFHAVYSDFLVHPGTGEVLYGDDTTDVNDFLSACYVRRAELIRNSKIPQPPKPRSFLIPAPIL